MFEMGRLVQACVEFRKGIECGDLVMEAYILMKLWELKGRAELKQSNYNEALRAYDESLEIAMRIGSEDGETLVRVAIDVAISMSGNTSQTYGAK